MNLSRLIVEPRCSHVVVALTLVGCGLLASSGCKKPDQIERYTVDKISQPEAETPRKSSSDRMLAAIVPHGSRLWFFKVTGPSDAVTPKLEEFTTFLKSVHFGAQPDAPPEWKAPDGWKQKPGSEMRFATLDMGTPENPLELTVIGLPKPEGVEKEYVLSNINRWRGQMQLGPITQEQVETETESVPLEGTTAILVNLQGTAAPSNMGRGPFSLGAGDGK